MGEEGGANGEDEVVGEVLLFNLLITSISRIPRQLSEETRRRWEQL